MNEIGLSLQSVEYKGERLVLAKVTPSSSPSVAVPHDICCVVDVSGSMRSRASLQTDVEQANFSILDIVKHSVKSIIQSLSTEDRLSLVSFESRAEVVFEHVKMNEDGKKRAEMELEKLVASGGTNLWDGLEMGLNVLKNASKRSCFRFDFYYYFNFFFIIILILIYFYYYFNFNFNLIFFFIFFFLFFNQ